MSVVLAVLVVVAFAGAIGRLGLAERAREVGDRARTSLEVLRDPALDDDTKERRLQRQSLRLFGLLGVLTGGSVLALGLPLLGVWVLDRAGVASLAEVLGVLQRVDFLAVTTVVGAVGYLLVRRARRT